MDTADKTDGLTIDQIELCRLLSVAWDSRLALLEQCNQQETTCFRLFHGTVEGLAGVSIDCYGEQLLIQSFHFSVPTAFIQAIEDFYFKKIIRLTCSIYHDRSASGSRRRSNDTYDDSIPLEANELGVTYNVDVKRLGQDPLLFLDMRVGRQWMLNHAHDKTVLNLFSYTCGIGVCAAKAGARQVWNVDFSSSALAVGESNALINGLDLEKIKFIESDYFPAIKQFAGIPVKGRQKRARNGRVVKSSLPSYPSLPKKQFDIVFMDPPRWAKSPFGTVDLVRDYQSLFKPALLTTKTGGTMVVCNNVAKVNLDDWISQLIRCAEKAGRNLVVKEILQPYEDFPSYDGNPPLKIAVLDVS